MRLPLVAATAESAAVKCQVGQNIIIIFIL